jgi:hypothetical protein
MRKSTTGYLVKLANGVFCWNSRVQKSIALSSTEAEYMSISDTTRQLVWIFFFFENVYSGTAQSTRPVTAQHHICKVNVGTPTRGLEDR